MGISTANRAMRRIGLVVGALAVVGAGSLASAQGARCRPISVSYPMLPARLAHPGEALIAFRTPVTVAGTSSSPTRPATRTPLTSRAQPDARRPRHDQHPAAVHQHSTRAAQRRPRARRGRDRPVRHRLHPGLHGELQPGHQRRRRGQRAGPVAAGELGDARLELLRPERRSPHVQGAHQARAERARPRQEGGPSQPVRRVASAQRGVPQRRAVLPGRGQQQRHRRRLDDRQALRPAAGPGRGRHEHLARQRR